ncbi:phosphatidylglycerophosphatase B [Symmachiella dynata]|uniref:Phosphatidylglycerophosphatase B n=1 Tax=Symmachiella dynata TaxID=2527995 RepID=A0A517ZV68_9PLAN|nr:phosphatase PAP2 family protein [Symmachiella dynata]QDU46373.1 phosphatidylglycerophosphatase B [Symmachiella dynata]
MYDRFTCGFRRFMFWLGSHELSTLVGFVLLTAGLWLFVELAEEVREGETKQVDRAILLSLRNPSDLSDPWGPQWVEELVRDITALGGIGVLTLITLAVVGYLLLQRNNSAALLVLVAVVGGLVVSYLLKWQFARPRPDLVPHGSHVLTASFPSGHAMMAATTYLTLGALLARVHTGRRLKAYFLLLAALLSISVGISRVYLGVHWPSDVLAGWTLGACWAILCWMVTAYLQRHGNVESTQPESPTPD